MASVEWSGGFVLSWVSFGAMLVPSPPNAGFFFMVNVNDELSSLYGNTFVGLLKVALYVLARATP